MKIAAAACLVLVGPLGACGVEGPQALGGRPLALDLLGPSTARQAVEAVCLANVEGTLVEVETDYLPHVIACENGAASFEALKAQAVAARSYLYYKAHAYPDSPIQDGTGDQVYTCNNQPTAIHYEAVATTAGEVLRYEDTWVAGFYVAGAVPSSDSCVAAPGDNDYSDTEGWVTYNWGRRGEGIEQTPLGWVNPGNHANRGCKSQNGADCLSDAGWGYEDILRFFYGMDIDLEVAEGECVAPDPGPHFCGQVHEGGVTVYDDGGACFIAGCVSEDAWMEVQSGEGGAARVATARASDEDCFGRWRVSPAVPGELAVDVHIPELFGVDAPLTYVVRHAHLDTEVTVAAPAAGWVELGTFFFDQGRHQWIQLGDVTGVSGDPGTGPFVPFDAVRLRDPDLPVDAGPDPDQPDAAGEDDDAGSAPPAGDGGASEEPYVELPRSVQPCACVLVPREGPAGAGAVAVASGAAWLVRRRRRR